jgi:site-specific DNA-methyltransferase (adenine-specific)
MPNNALYYGDNLHILRKHIAGETVDLVYLDPPFNSNRDYNVLFKEQSGEGSPAQMKAFTDTWKWSEAAYHDFVTECERPQLIELMQGFINTIGRNDATAYLVMMAPRLAELHRVLKPTGSLYLHCDATVSHYLKLILDVLFSPKNFRNEIIWKRTNVHSDSKTWSRVSDTIFFYTKSDSFTWNPPYAPHSDQHIESKYRSQDNDGRFYTLSDMTSPNPRPNMMYEWQGHTSPPNGWRYSKETMAKLDSEGRIWYPTDKLKRPRLKRYLDEMAGTLLGNVWTDIFPLNSQAGERLGYPTQKPLSLLERIIAASSNTGDTVLDPFAGCGTATIAAQKLGRRWIGIDVTHLAIALIKYRLSDSFGLKDKKDFAVIGEPTTSAEAQALALQDRDEFQKWAIGLVERARPAQDKKGADRGLDGILYFRDDPRAEAKKCIIQVKSGHVGAALVRDLRGTMEREKATLALFITLDPPTGPMEKEAGAAGFYTTPLGNRAIPRLQIRTAEQLLAGQPFQVPSSAMLEGVRQAGAVKADSQQQGLEF